MLCILNVKDESQYSLNKILLIWLLASAPAGALCKSIFLKPVGILLFSVSEHDKLIKKYLRFQYG